MKMRAQRSFRPSDLAIRMTSSIGSPNKLGMTSLTDWVSAIEVSAMEVSAIEVSAMGATAIEVSAIGVSAMGASIIKVSAIGATAIEVSAIGVSVIETSVIESIGEWATLNVP